MIKSSKFGEVELLDILTDYQVNFHGKKCVITTNYNGLKKFEVSFHDDGLPHLLGLHYVSNIKFGSGIVDMIASKKMTIKTIRNHHEFNNWNLKTRIMLYPFIYDVFVHNKITVCIPTDNMKPNPQKLNCVFTEIRGKEEIVLGLQRDSKDGVFKLATLHSNRRPRYNKMRCSIVKDISWI